jgi:hypothetical protein
VPRRETIQIRGTRERDRFNDPIGPEPVWMTVNGATVAPRESSEDDRRGQIIIKGFMVVVPGMVTVTERHEIKIRNDVYQIEGAVGDYGRRKIFYVTRPA